MQTLYRRRPLDTVLRQFVMSDLTYFRRTIFGTSRDRIEIPAEVHYFSGRTGDERTAASRATIWAIMSPHPISAKDVGGLSACFPRNFDMRRIVKTVPTSVSSASLHFPSTVSSTAACILILMPKETLSVSLATPKVFSLIASNNRQTKSLASHWTNFSPAPYYLTFQYTPCSCRAPLPSLLELSSVQEQTELRTRQIP